MQFKLNSKSTFKPPKQKSKHDLSYTLLIVLLLILRVNKKNMIVKKKL